MLISKAQNPYPIVPIDSIQYVSPSRLAISGSTAPDYTTPVFKNLTYGDTIRVEGIVVTNPQIFSVSSFKVGYLQRPGGGAWSGIGIRCDASGSGLTLSQLNQETKFYEKFIPNRRVRVTGVLREYSGETQILLIKNDSNWSNAIEDIQVANMPISWNEIRLQDMMLGSPTPSTSNWFPQKQTAEKWEGTPVIIRNVTVQFVSNLGTSSTWRIQDSLGNVVQISNSSGYFRRDDIEDTIPKIPNTFFPPPVGTKLSYIRGTLNEGTSNRYFLAPQNLDDVMICQTPCNNGIEISTPTCFFDGNLLKVEIKQYNVPSNDTAYLQFSNNIGFGSILQADTLNNFGVTTNQINSLKIFALGKTYARLILKNAGIISNIDSFSTSPNINFSLPDTTIGFNKDSVLLSGPLGPYSYRWNTGDTTRNIWGKISRKYSIEALTSQGCKANFESELIVLKGIKNNDTTICANSSLNLTTWENNLISNVVPNNGLVGWWPFNGNATDESGNGNNGTVNGALLTTDRFGNINSAFNFDGVNDWININNSNSLNPNSQITISAWVNTLAYNSMGASMVVNKGWDQSPGHYDLLVFSSNNKSRFVIGSNIYVESSSIINTNQWSLITASLDGLTMKVYVNGKLENTVLQSNNNSFGTNTNPLYIGKHDYNNAPYYFNGIIDDVGIWNRALSNNEIQKLYDNEIKVESRWSTNDTTSSINVFPSKDTAFYCTFSVGSYTFKDSVRVFVKGLPNKQVGFPKLGLCYKDTINLTAATGLSYQWYKESQMINNSQSIGVYEPGSYKVVLIDSLGCVNRADAINIFTAPKLKTNFIINDSAQCLKDNVFAFSDSTKIDSGNYTLSWLLEQNNTSNSFNPIYTYKTIGNKLIKLVGTTNYGCKDSIAKIITVNPNPSVGFMLGDSIGLETSKPYIYSVAQQLNHIYNWDVTNGIIINGQGSNAATIQWINNGKGKIKLSLTNPFNCSDSLQKDVNIGSVGIMDINASNSIKLSPNPNNGTFSIGLNSILDETISVKIFNSIGQNVWTKEYDTTILDNVLNVKTNLTKGVYSLIVKKGESIYLSRFVIK